MTEASDRGISANFRKYHDFKGNFIMGRLSLTLKFQKISITRGRKKFFSSQIRNNLNTVYAPPKARILTRNPVKLTLEPLSHYARAPTIIYKAS